MRKGWGVVLLGRALESANPIYHEYAQAGITACGRKWSFVQHNPIEKHAVWVRRKNAEKFARPCKKCGQASQ